MTCRTFLKNTAGLGALVVVWALSASHVHAADRDDDKGSDAIRVDIITGRDGPHLGIYLNSVAACKGLARSFSKDFWESCLRWTFSR